MPHGVADLDGILASSLGIRLDRHDYKDKNISLCGCKGPVLCICYYLTGGSHIYGFSEY